MEAENGQTSPLLRSPSRRLSQNGRLRRGNSVNSLRNEFISRLPDKLRSGVDDESLYEVDFSKTHGLTQGDEFSLILINSFYGFIFFYSFVN